MKDIETNIEFFPIPGLRYHEISRCGIIRRVSRMATPKQQLRSDRKKVIPARRLTPQLNNGYFRIDIYSYGKRFSDSIHRLLAITFIPNPEGKPCINHINGVKTDNRLENLEWVTYQENNIHAVDNGLRPIGTMMYNVKLSESDVFEVRRLYACGLSKNAISKKYKVSPGTIYNIIVGRSWRHLKSSTVGKFDGALT